MDRLRVLKERRLFVTSDVAADLIDVTVGEIRAMVASGELLAVTQQGGKFIIVRSLKSCALSAGFDIEM
jgi:hypothetical protein